MKYQNDYVPEWSIDEDQCHWYIQYIAQGCTKGGNRPSDPKNQVSDCGTYYEPVVGSVDMKWR